MLNLLKDPARKSESLVALIDGEHYPKLNLDALEYLKRAFQGSFRGIIFLGGTEKLNISNLKDFFKAEVFEIKSLDTDFLEALDYFKPDIAYDLSDEPIVNYEIRMKIASYCLSRCCDYMGPDFVFESEPKDITTDSPSLSIIGTGKRIGKTAASSFIAKYFKEKGIDLCVVAMGRGGPSRPQVLEGEKVQIDASLLLEISDKGQHASSDYIEDALMSGVTTIGCRRCGGGFGGKFFFSNIEQGIDIANKLKKELIIVEGSGASIPPVDTDATICLIGAHQKWESIVGYLGIYRIMISDLVLLTMCEEPMADKAKVDFLKKKILQINPDANILTSIFRPVPLGDIRGKKVFLAMTAKEKIIKKIAAYLEEKYKCRIVKSSYNLSRRKELVDDLSSTDEYHVLLTELKAASVDIVTDYARKNHKEIYYLNNDTIILEDKNKREFALKLIDDKLKNRRSGDYQHE